MTRLSALLLALLTSACAVTPESTQEASKLRCTKEAPTGSSLPVTRCRSQEEIDRDKDVSRAATDEMTRPHGSKPGPTGQ